jgi:hypothetical protein
VSLGTTTFGYRDMRLRRQLFSVFFLGLNHRGEVFLAFSGETRILAEVGRSWAMTMAEDREVRRRTAKPPCVPQRKYGLFADTGRGYQMIV